MLKEKAKTINAISTMADVVLALISFNIALYFEYGKISILHQKDSVILQLLIIIFGLFFQMGLGQMYYIVPDRIQWFC